MYKQWHLRLQNVQAILKLLSLASTCWAHTTSLYMWMCSAVAHCESEVTVIVQAILQRCRSFGYGPWLRLKPSICSLIMNWHLCFRAAHRSSARVSGKGWGTTNQIFFVWYILPALCRGGHGLRKQIKSLLLSPLHHGLWKAACNNHPSLNLRHA